MQVFMESINSVWPHKDHLLVNIGMPGADANSFANHVCVEQQSPQQVGAQDAAAARSVHCPHIHCCPANAVVEWPGGKAGASAGGRL